MPRMSKDWYIANNMPVPETFEKKNYNWYVQRGLTPPANLKVPKVIKGYPPIMSVGSNVTILPTPQLVVTNETDEQIEARILKIMLLHCAKLACVLL